MKMKILKSLILFIVLSVIFLGTFQFHKSINGSVSLLKTAFTYPSIAILEVNDFIKDISAGNQKETVPLNKKDRGNRILRFLFFMMSAVLISSEKILLMFLIAALMIAFTGLKKVFYEKDDVLKPQDMKFYRWLGLKFLSPVQKCIQNLADKYDINPIKVYGWAVYALKINPHFVKRTECGFFLCVN